MAGTPGTSITQLARIEVGGETWYFPEAYNQAMTRKGTLSAEQIVRVQQAWVEEMKAKGFTPELVKENKATIAKSATEQFKNALDKVVKESAATASSAGGDVGHALPDTTGRFATNETHWFGLERQIPPDPLAAHLEYEFIDGSQEMAERARIFSKGHRPLLIIGDAGIGKTAEVYHYSQELGWGVIRFGHDAHTEVEDILGKHVRKPDGKIEYEYGPLARAVRDGLIYIADEVNALKAGPLMVYQMINEANSDLILTNNNGEVIKRHPRFRWVGTMNPTSYAGTNELNVAQLGRPYVFMADYPTEEKEAQILAKNFPKLTKDKIKNLIRFANEVRARKKKDPDGIAYAVSTRDLVKVAELVTELDFPVRRAVEICVLNTVNALGDVSETQAIEALIKSRFTA